MMNLIFTLLTIAGGMLLGSAGVFLSRKRMSPIKIVFSGFGMMFLLCGCGIIGILCQQKICHTDNLDWFDIITVAIVILFGFIGGAFVALLPQIKKEIRQDKKLDWRVIIYACAFIITPLTMWGYALYHGSVFSTLNLLSVMVICGFTIISIIFIIDNICLYIWRHLH